MLSKLPARKKWLPAKKAASQKQLPAKCQCNKKAAASQTWLPAKRDCQPIVAASQMWLPVNRLCQPMVVTGFKRENTLKKSFFLLCFWICCYLFCHQNSNTDRYVDQKFRIRETSNLSTDVDSSTDTKVGWTKNTQKQKKLKTEK